MVYIVSVYCKPLLQVSIVSAYCVYCKCLPWWAALGWARAPGMPAWVAQQGRSCGFAFLEIGATCLTFDICMNNVHVSNNRVQNLASNVNSNLSDDYCI